MAKFTQQINETNTDYEPTVADRIQRVLYRLDHGEQLTHNALKSDDNFCVLGLFADESGIGGWEGDAYVVGNESNAKTLGIILTNYYGFHTCGGSFNVCDLSENLRQTLVDEHILRNNYDDVCMNITLINDYYKLTDEKRNAIIAAIIRSGALFRKEGD